MKKTAAELATIVGGKLYGNAEQEIVDVRGAMDAGPEHVTGRICRTPGRISRRTYPGRQAAGKDHKESYSMR